MKMGFRKGIKRPKKRDQNPHKGLLIFSKSHSTYPTTRKPRYFRHTAGVMIGLDHRDPRISAGSTIKGSLLPLHLLDPAAEPRHTEPQKNRSPAYLSKNAPRTRPPYNQKTEILPAIVSKSLIRFRHLMRIFFLLERGTGIIISIHEL